MKKKKGVQKTSKKQVGKKIKSPVVVQNHTPYVVGIGASAGGLEELELQNNALRSIQAEPEFTQHKYYNLFDLAPVGYLNINTFYWIIEANFTASKLFSIRKKFLINKPFTQLIDKDYQEIFRDNIKKIINSGGKEQFKIKLKRNKEELFWALVECSFNTEKDLIAPINLTITDITKRKRAEEILKESEENQRAILNATKESVFMFDREGKILSANATAANRLERSVDEIIGHNFSEFLEPERASERTEYLNKVFTS